VKEEGGKGSEWGPLHLGFCFLLGSVRKWERTGTGDSDRGRERAMSIERERAMSRERYELAVSSGDSGVGQ